jgi:hypothetical protein
MAPDPTFAFVGGFVLPYTRFCICPLDDDTVLHLGNIAIFDYNKEF